MSWINVKLGDIANFSNGINFSKEAYGKGIKLITVSSFANRVFPDYDSLEEIKDTAVRSNDYLMSGDVVFVRSNGNKELVGRCMLIESPPEKVTYSGFCIRARFKDTSMQHPAFWTYHFKDMAFRKAMSGAAIGANIQNLSQGRLALYETRVPDYETQTKIAKILSTYDTLIENNQKQILLLEEAAQIIYTEWFVKFQFPKHETVNFIDGIPKDWRRKSILDNDVFIFVKSKVLPFEGKKQYYATADVSGTKLISSGLSVTYFNKPSRASIQPTNNSVWFARMSNSYKILNYYGKTSSLANTSILSSGFVGFTSLEGCYGFVYQTISSKMFDAEKNRYATGSTQVSLTNEGLKKIEILIPTIDLIKQYSKKVEPLMQKAELLKQNCLLLQQARERLLPKLMSGEIEV